MQDGAHIQLHWQFPPHANTRKHHYESWDANKNWTVMSKRRNIRHSRGGFRARIHVQNSDSGSHNDWSQNDAQNSEHGDTAKHTDKNQQAVQGSAPTEQNWPQETIDRSANRPA